MERRDDNICEESLAKLEFPEESGDETSDEDMSTSDDPLSSDDVIKRKRIAKMNYEYNMKTLLLTLPRDVLVTIMKWVVSSRLDVVSLARFSQVCKGFYNLSQDPSLWYAMCLRVWGSNVIRKPYASWRDQFISRPHAHIHGVYISKTSYVRAGDASVTMSSKPYFLVEYYRILRFFPNGEVLMMTTPREPREVVHKLESKSKKVQGLLLGRYVLHEDQRCAIIHATLRTCYKSKDTSHVSQIRTQRQLRSEPPKLVYEYRLEMKLASTSERKKFNKLIWLHHSCCSRCEKSGNENTSVYDLSRQYPALYFNKVKSFTAEAYKPV